MYVVVYAHSFFKVTHFVYFTVAELLKKPLSFGSAVLLMVL